MNFRAKYFALERDFEEQVRKDNEKFGWRGETGKLLFAYSSTGGPGGFRIRRDGAFCSQRCRWDSERGEKLFCIRR